MLPIVHANSAPNEPWYPAGPATDSLTYSIFADETTEFQALQAHSIDFTDWPLSPDLISPFTSDPSLFVSQTIPDAGYFELQFNMGNVTIRARLHHSKASTTVLVLLAPASEVPTFSGGSIRRDSVMF